MHSQYHVTVPFLQIPGLPPYDTVKPEHVVPGMLQVLNELHADVDALEAHVLPTVSAHRVVLFYEPKACSPAPS